MCPQKKMFRLFFSGLDDRRVLIFGIRTRTYERNIFFIRSNPVKLLGSLISTWLFTISAVLEKKWRNHQKFMISVCSPNFLTYKSVEKMVPQGGGFFVIFNFPPRTPVNYAYPRSISSFSLRSNCLPVSMKHLRNRPGVAVVLCALCTLVYGFES